MTKSIKHMRYIVAGLFVVSALLGFMNIFQVAVVKVSLIDILKLGFGKGDTLLMRQLADVMQEYMKPFTYGLLAFFGIIVMSAVLVAVLDWSNGCKVAVIGAFLVNAYIVIVLLAIYGKFQEMEEGISFFDLGGVIKIYKLPIILWILIYIFIFIFGQSGIREEENSGSDPIEDIPSPIPPKPVPIVPPRPMSPINNFFEGAVKGESGLYKNRIYKLKDRMLVFVCEENNQIFWSDANESKLLVEVYFVKEYREYCITPKEMRCCFLESGQPLGKDRTYYLPRGTKIFICDNKNSFELV